MERGYPDIDEAVNEVFEESIHGHMELDAGVLALALEEVEEVARLEPAMSGRAYFGLAAGVSSSEERFRPGGGRDL